MGFRDTFFARALLEIQFRRNFILGFTLDLVQVGCYLIILGFTWDPVQKELYLRFSYTNEPCFKIMSMNFT